MDLIKKYSSDKLTTDDLKNASRDELKQLLIVVDNHISLIRIQLTADTKAKAHLKNTDPNWFKNATSARRIKGKLSQTIGNILGERKRKEKELEQKVNGISLTNLIRALEIVLDEGSRRKVYERAKEFEDNPGNY